MLTAQPLPVQMEMERKEYGKHSSRLSVLLLRYVIPICCALSFDLYAEPLWRTADNQLNTRFNLVFSDAPSTIFQPLQWRPSEAGELVVDSELLSAIGPGHWFGHWPAHLDNGSGGASVMAQLTPNLVARMFPSAPRANIERYLPMIRRAMIERGLVDKMMVVMSLATIRVETSRFDPISEVPSALNTQSPGPPFNKYDRRADLGNQGPPDGAMFKGRGFIQLTGRKNYVYYGGLLGYDLIGNPELANTPQPAAQILAAYLKENESAIRSALAAGDLATARRIVNGGLNGLDRFTTAFLIGNQLIQEYSGELAISTNSAGMPKSPGIESLFRFLSGKDSIPPPPGLALS